MAALAGPRIGVVGLGAIGGSVSLALLDRDVRPCGFTSYPGDALAASQAGVEVVGSVADVVGHSDIVLLAVPLDALAHVAAEAFDACTGRESSPTLLHAASLQRPAAIGADARVLATLIGAHPIAGTHAVGFGAARADMFRDAVVSVESRATARQRADAELLWSLAGAATVVYDDAAEHDRRMAWVSHLPQLASTAIAGTLARARWQSAQLGPGGRDSTRLAESALAVWLPILDRAPHDTIDSLAALERSIAGIRELIQRRDWTGLSRLWEEARRWRASETTQRGVRES